MEINDVCRNIRFSEFTNDELNEIIQAVKFRRTLLTQEKKRDFFPGLHVKFLDKYGRTVTGSIEKVNRKFVVVNTSSGRWRVPATMLEQVTGPATV